MTTQINSFRDLTVWQVGMDLADVCFDIVEAIPHPYRFTFANQLIPAGISIPSTIAEGSRRPTKAYPTTCRIARLAWRSRDTLRTDPSPEIGAGPALEQGGCTHRAYWQDAARLSRVTGSTTGRATSVIGVAA